MRRALSGYRLDDFGVMERKRYKVDGGGGRKWKEIVEGDDEVLRSGTQREDVDGGL